MLISNPGFYMMLLFQTKKKLCSLPASLPDTVWAAAWRLFDGDLIARSQRLKNRFFPVFFSYAARPINTLSKALLKELFYEVDLVFGDMYGYF